MSLTSQRVSMIPRDESWRHSRQVYELPLPEHQPTSVYIHVPFCLHRCGYCDFTLVADHDDLVEQYLAALSNELMAIEGRSDVSTIYLGGGTPTHLTAAQLERLLTDVLRVFTLTPDGEFTVEANPDGLTDDRLSVLAGGGVNRLSLGVQSFDSGVLKTLERSHSAQDVFAVIERAGRYLNNISIDLIFGVPGQSHDIWEGTLLTATTLPIQHISAYGLTFEKGTAFYRRRLQGVIAQTSSEEERRQYETGISFLNDAGFAQYEISNFARTGFQSIHNNVYWAAREYFAFGPGAARYVSGVRSTNSRHVERWISSWLDRTPILQEIEQLTPEEKAREAVMLGLRRNRGIELSDFPDRFGVTIESLAPQAMDRHVANGLLEVTNEEPRCLRLTDEGRFLADSVVVDFL